MTRKGTWYRDGFEAGKAAALDNLAEPDSRKELEEYAERDELGAFVGELREHQVQFAGDVSYDVGEPGGPTERQYELWEEGFTEGFIETAEEGLAKPTRKGKPPTVIPPGERKEPEPAPPTVRPSRPAKDIDRRVASLEEIVAKLEKERKEEDETDG